MAKVTGVSVASRSRALSVAVLALILLVPCAAWAAWGAEIWGDMVWGQLGGAGATSLPSTSTRGRVALAIVLTIIPTALLVRRRRVSGR